jgi:hypothetical protein
LTLTTKKRVYRLYLKWSPCMIFDIKPILTVAQSIETTIQTEPGWTGG